MSCSPPLAFLGRPGLSGEALRYPERLCGEGFPPFCDFLPYTVPEAITPVQTNNSMYKLLIPVQQTGYEFLFLF